MVQKIEVYPGPMYSGKTDILITALERETHVAKNPILFKPIIDTRADNEVASRTGKSMAAIKIYHSSEIIDVLIEKLATTPAEKIVIGIDEAQFFDDDLPDVIYTIANDLNIRVIVAGLARDFRRIPFGPMPKIIAMAQEIHPINALCTFLIDEENEIYCSDDASETYRSVNGEPADFNDPVVSVDDKNIVERHEQYEARCLKHHFIKNPPEKYYSK